MKTDEYQPEPGHAKPPEPRSLIKLCDEQKVQAALALFHEHGEVLRALKGVDLQVVGGFITLQLALAAWLVEHPPKTASAKFGLFWLSAILTGLVWEVLRRNDRRRREVVEGVVKTNEALRFNEQDVYIRHTALAAMTTFSPWLALYRAVCCLTLIGVAVVIFLGN